MCIWFYMGARVGWRAGEAWARGEDESAIEHHQIKRYLMPALTRPARKQVHSLSTERKAVLLPAKNTPRGRRELGLYIRAEKWI